MGTRFGHKPRQRAPAAPVVAWDGCTCGEWFLTRTKAPLEFWSDWERVERICDVHWEERSC